MSRRDRAPPSFRDRLRHWAGGGAGLRRIALRLWSPRSRGRAPHGRQAQGLDPVHGGAGSRSQQRERARLPAVGRPGLRHHRAAQPRLRPDERHASLLQALRRLHAARRALRRRLARGAHLDRRQRDELGPGVAALRRDDRGDHPRTLRPGLPSGAQRDQGAVRPRGRPGYSRRARDLRAAHRLWAELRAVPRPRAGAAGGRRTRRDRRPHLHARHRPRARGGRGAHGPSLRGLPLQLPRLSRLPERAPRVGPHPPRLHHGDRPGRPVGGRQSRLGARGLSRDRRVEPRGGPPEDPLAAALPLLLRPVGHHAQGRRHRRLPPGARQRLPLDGLGRHGARRRCRGQRERRRVELCARRDAGGSRARAQHWHLDVERRGRRPARHRRRQQPALVLLLLRRLRERRRRRPGLPVPVGCAG